VPGDARLLKHHFGAVVVVPESPNHRQNDVRRFGVVGDVDELAKCRQNVLVVQNFDAPVGVKSDVAKNSQRRQRYLSMETENKDERFYFWTRKIQV
jgi:hypothetical protein